MSFFILFYFIIYLTESYAALVRRADERSDLSPARNGGAKVMIFRLSDKSLHIFFRTNFQEIITKLSWRNYRGMIRINTESGGLVGMSRV